MMTMHEPKQNLLDKVRALKESASSNPRGFSKGSFQKQFNKICSLEDEVAQWTNKGWSEEISVGFISDGYGRYMQGTRTKEVDVMPYVQRYESLKSLFATAN